MSNERHEAEHWHRLGLDAYADGRIAEALEYIERALACRPDAAHLHADWAVISKGVAPVDMRVQRYLRAIELDPLNTVFPANLAAILNSIGRYDEAEHAAKTALSLDSRRPESWHNLGSALSGLQRWDEALACFESAMSNGIQTASTFIAAGRAAIALRRYPVAVAHFSSALATQDLSLQLQIECWSSMGRAHAALGNGKAALHSFQQGLALAPGHTGLLIDLGNLYKRLRQVASARQCYEAVLARLPDCVEAMFNLASLSQDTADYDDAIKGYRHVLSVDPQLMAGWQNLAACLTYSPDSSPGEVKTALTGFERAVAPLRRHRSFENTSDPFRRLNVGYVSADFRAHPVGYLALPLIEGHDRARVHVTCYSNHHARDEWTEKFIRTADTWRDVATLDDDAFADQIVADGIDLLIDLSGHSEGNRLLTFARKPAPIQITWWGYVTTTGMRAMDWRISHGDADPPGSESDYAERLWRLPGSLWVFRPLPEMPEPAPLPAATNGFVTFGALNRFSKNSTKTLMAWADILRQVPGSRLLLCAPPDDAREKVRAIFLDAGIDLRRISIFAPMDHKKFWDLHACIDIALDPFPFNGGMTTCETLWMGVPVVTCSGDASRAEDEVFSARFASRMGRAILSGIGLPSLVSRTTAEYIQNAVALAKDVDRLAYLRANLRTRMSMSPLMDEKRFVDEVETAYRSMWHQYCEEMNA